MTGLTVAAEDGETVIFGHTVSTLQTDVVVANGAITGTLHKVNSGALKRDWGAGYFLAVKFTSIDADATSVLVGLQPSEGSGLVELINDPDKNGVFKITDKDKQKLVVMQKCSGFNLIQKYDLSGLTMSTS